MTRCIVVFKSKTETMKFIDLMGNRGLFAKSVSTPKEAKIGCGLSAEISYSDRLKAMQIIKSNNFKSFYSILLIEKYDNRVSMTKI